MHFYTYTTWFFVAANIKVIDYTDCKKQSKQLQHMCKTVINNNTQPIDRDCTCLKKFTINETWKGKVFMYYGLKNFHDHSQYATSRDVKQLKGNAGNAASPSCNPLRYCQGEQCTNGYVLRHPDKFPDGTLTGTPPFLPCGETANRMFSGKAQLNT